MIHEPVTFRSDDADEDPRYALTIYQANNGDWYVSVMPDGHRIGPNVRICTSGGASHSHPGLSNAIHKVYEAIEAGRDRQPRQQPEEPRKPLMCFACLNHRHTKCEAKTDAGCGCPECSLAARISKRPELAL